jgi:hypothetical protein
VPETVDEDEVMQEACAVPDAVDRDEVMKEACAVPGAVDKDLIFEAKRMLGEANGNFNFVNFYELAAKFLGCTKGSKGWNKATRHLGDNIWKQLEIEVTEVHEKQLETEMTQKFQSLQLETEVTQMPAKIPKPSMPSVPSAGTSRIDEVDLPLVDMNVLAEYAFCRLPYEPRRRKSMDVMTASEDATEDGVIKVGEDIDVVVYRSSTPGNYDTWEALHWWENNEKWSSKFGGYRWLKDRNWYHEVSNMKVQKLHLKQKVLQLQCTGCDGGGKIRVDGLCKKCLNVKEPSTKLLSDILAPRPPPDGSLYKMQHLDVFRAEDIHAFNYDAYQKAYGRALGAWYGNKVEKAGVGYDGQ